MFEGASDLLAGLSLVKENPLMAFAFGGSGSNKKIEELEKRIDGLESDFKDLKTDVKANGDKMDAMLNYFGIPQTLASQPAQNQAATTT